MTNLERLKLELSNKEYYTDTEYNIFLEENGLTPTATYNKTTDNIKLLETVVGVLETLANDVDLMRKLDNKDLMSVGEASKYLQQRISNIKSKIVEIKLNEDTTYSNIRPFFTNSRR